MRSPYEPKPFVAAQCGSTTNEPSASTCRMTTGTSTLLPVDGSMSTVPVIPSNPFVSESAALTLPASQPPARPTASNSSFIESYVNDPHVPGCAPNIA